MTLTCNDCGFKTEDPNTTDCPACRVALVQELAPTSSSATGKSSRKIPDKSNVSKASQETMPKSREDPSPMTQAHSPELEELGKEMEESAQTEEQLEAELDHPDETNTANEMKKLDREEEDQEKEDQKLEQNLVRDVDDMIKADGPKHVKKSNPTVEKAPTQKTNPDTTPDKTQPKDTGNATVKKQAVVTEL